MKSTFNNLKTKITPDRLFFWGVVFAISGVFLIPFGEYLMYYTMFSFGMSAVLMTVYEVLRRSNAKNSSEDKIR